MVFKKPLHGDSMGTDIQMDSINTVFPTAYFPSTAYLKAYFGHPNSQIEIHETYPKQTIRNRCEILSSNGIQRMTVPVIRVQGSKTKTKDIQIEMGKWQNDHWRAVQSAYAAAPYFEDYAEDIHNIIYKSPKYLIELNENILAFIHGVLDIPLKVHNTSTYSITQLNDFRNIDFMDRTTIKEYQQVFSYDREFIPNLSVIDLLFNEGPFLRKWILNQKS
tara:strand:- start:276 stop:932 length:657 start_codon:yes stop_codon:yes gene_type:complete